ncbi:MAG: hypothetical protein LQ352_000936 [Teloschistes flavicans]|nr:MAG: hypothetical protein LQ352_000936 [Teloschistes flavicans]
MELYSDAENPQIADDGIDIDLDLTSDPPRNEDDEEMIEDPENSILEQGLRQNIENIWDDRMVDDTEQDDGLQHDDDLDTVGLEEPLDDQDLIIDDGEQVLQPLNSNPPEVQDTLQDNSRHQNSSNELPQDLQTAAHSASQSLTLVNMRSSTSEPMITSDDVATDDFSEPQDSPTLDQPQGKHSIRRTQSELIRPNFPLPEDPVDALRTSNIAGSALQLPGAAQVAADTADGDSGQHNKAATPDQGSDIAGRDHTEKSRSSHTTSGGSILEWSDPAGTDTERNPSETEIENFPPRNGEEENFHDRSQPPTATVLHISQEEASSQAPPYIHQVVVVYEGSEMFLFPPVEHEQDLSQTYFLSDEALAVGPLYNLFRECRNVLGESISDKVELQITIEVLGLTICESTVDESSTSLLDILDVFLQLHSHDGIEDPPHLTDGKGMSQLPREQFFEDATSPETPPEPELKRKSDNMDQKAVSRDVLEQAQLQDNHEEHTLSHAGNQAKHPSNVSPKLPTGDHVSKTEGAKSEPGTEVIDGTNTVYSVADFNIDSSARKLATESSNATSSLQALDELADEQYEDELEEEEELNQEDDADPKESNSTNSSTVQGDDTLGAKNIFAISTDATNSYGLSKSGQQLAHGSLENFDAEYLVTNEHLEADLDNLDELGLDSHWHDTKEPHSALMNALSARDMSTRDLNCENNSKSIDSSNENPLNVPMDGKAFQMPHHRSNQNPRMVVSEEEHANTEEDELTISQSNGIDALNDHPPETANQGFDQGQQTSYILDPDCADAKNLALQGQGGPPSVKDEDEIDFDDLENDATAEDPQDDLENDVIAEDSPDVSINLHLEPAGTSSPGALKRARADVDVASLDDDPSKLFSKVTSQKNVHADEIVSYETYTIHMT